MGVHKSVVISVATSAILSLQLLRVEECEELGQARVWVHHSHKDVTCTHACVIS